MACFNLTHANKPRRNRDTSRIVALVTDLGNPSTHELGMFVDSLTLLWIYAGHRVEQDEQIVFDGTQMQDISELTDCA